MKEKDYYYNHRYYSRLLLLIGGVLLCYLPLKADAQQRGNALSFNWENSASPDDQYIIYVKRDDEAKHLEKIGKQPVHSGSSSFINSTFLPSPFQGSRYSIAPEEITVSGTVTDMENGEPLPGVSVLVKGTTTGTVTDVDGIYKLNVPDDVETLVFSSVGYATQEVAVNGRSEINVILAPDVQSLSEVVVTGYSTQSKRDITGSVTTVEPEELTKIAASNVAQQLQGRAAGVTVGTDNRPGGNVMVRIRGFGTINNNDPLYVIDGVPTKGGLNNINPNNIESLQILKDASAASIYGSRAANGVVIITTKKGKAGVPKITFDARYGMQTPSNKLDLLNTQQLGDLLWRQNKNAGQLINGNPSHPQYGNGAEASIPDYIFPTGASEGDPGTDPGEYDASDSDGDGFNLITKANKQGTDWYDVIFDPAPIQEYNLGASGGSETGRYALSLNYFTQDGIVRYTNFDRYSLRANTEFFVKDRIRVGENFEFSVSDEKGSFNNNSEGNAVSMAYRMQPIVPAYDIMGNFAGAKGGGLGNANSPLAILYRGKDNLNRRLRGFGNAFLEVDVLEGLIAKTSIGIDYNTFNSTSYSIRNIEAAEPASSNALFNGNNYEYTWTWYNTLNYNKVIGEDHNLNVLIGTEAINSVYRQFSAGRTNFFTDDLVYRYLRAGQAGISNNGDGWEWALFSLFGKVNYSLKDRYLLEATVRRDGSSRFGQNNRYAIFPAFSAGWRISEEAFFSDVAWLNDLKLRAGWGQTGNQEIGNYNGFNTFLTSLANSSYDLAGSSTSVVAGFDTQAFGNPDAKWETTTSTNVGIDAAILNGALGFNIDWYTRLTSDMLYPVSLPGIRGDAVNPFVNVGEMKNSGIDIGVNYSGNALGGELTYGINANFSTYKNEVVKLTGNEDEVLLGPTLRNYKYTRSVAGRPLSSFYGYIIDGVMQSEADVQNYAKYPGYYDATVYVNGEEKQGVGKYKFRDINDDGIINDEDRTWIGSPHPDFSYGLNLNLGYKNFDLTMFFQGVQGNNLINYVRRWVDFNTFQGNRSVRMLDESWTPDNPDAALPILDANDNMSLLPSTYFIEDGSYLRMKNLQLGYSLPSDMLPRFGFDRFRIYAQAQNLFTVTNYSGLDPEVNLRDYGAGNDTQVGVDEGIYPTPRIFQIGVNLGF